MAWKCTRNETDQLAFSSRRRLALVVDASHPSRVDGTVSLPLYFFPQPSTQFDLPLSSLSIVLPIHRMLLPLSKTSSPIPSLTERQFVVSRSTASKAEESLTRSLFWYREELLGLVQASWKEVRSPTRLLVFFLPSSRRLTLARFVLVSTSPEPPAVAPSPSAPSASPNPCSRSCEPTRSSSGLTSTPPTRG